MVSQPATVTQRNYVLDLTQDRVTDNLTAGQMVDIIFLKYTPADKMHYCPATKTDVSDLIKALLAAPRRRKSTPFTVTTTNFQLNGLPASRYAVRRTNDPDVVDFYQVTQRSFGKKNIYQLFGAPGQWRRRLLTGADRDRVVNTIAVNPLTAAQLYGLKFTTCAFCNSPLSKPQSIAQRIGPVCIKRFTK